MSEEKLREVTRIEEEPNKVSQETIVRTICLVIALINQLLVMFGKGKIPYTENEIYQAVSYVVMVIVAIWTWWKNNSFTVPAIKADKYMEFLRKEESKNREG